MELLESDYEQKLLLELPPHARDLASELLSTRSLGELLSLREQQEPDKALLATKRVPERNWYELMNAAVLAKTTYFLPNPKFSQEEIYYLIKVASTCIHYPLKQGNLKDLIEFSETQDMPVLTNWLRNFSKLLLKPS